MGIVSILISILIFGVLIFIHELGHFIAAILCGVKVETFSIGYGNALVSKTIRGVKFQIGYFPFGGFCSFKGEDPETGDESSDSFMGAHPFKRIVIAASGAIANLIFAFVCAGVFLAIPYTAARYEPVIDVYSDWKYAGKREGVPPAYAAGLRAGDRVLAINGDAVDDYADLYVSDIKKLASTNEVVFTVDRQGETRTFAILGSEFVKNGGNDVGYFLFLRAIIDEVVTNGAAARVGLMTGDEILAVNETPIASAESLREIVYDNPNVVLDLRVLRNGVVTNIEVAPNRETSGGRAFGLLGVTFLPPSPIQTNRVEGAKGFAVVTEGAAFIGTTLVDYVRSLGYLITGNLPVRESLGGPVRIVQLGSEIARSFDVRAILNFTAIISLILFVMNLLPIPVVDGSLIVYAIIEWIMRRPIKRSILARIQTIGMVVLIAFGVFVVFNDVFQIFFR